jgi:hypothetical protein
MSPTSASYLSSVSEQLAAATAEQTSDGNPPATILIVYSDGSKPAKLPGLFVPAW